MSEFNPKTLDWVKLEDDMNEIAITETTGQRFMRKCKENPLVPIGTGVTVGALSYGLFNFYHGKRLMQQKMMRLRVAAQLFTVIAASGGVIHSILRGTPPDDNFAKTGRMQ